MRSARKRSNQVWAGDRTIAEPRQLVPQGSVDAIEPSTIEVTFHSVGSDAETLAYLSSVCMIG